MGNLAMLQGEVLAVLSQYQSAWNETVHLLNAATKSAGYPVPVALVTLAKQYPAFSAANCVNEINAVLQNADRQLKKLVRDIGLEGYLPVGPGAGGMILMAAIPRPPKPGPGTGPGYNERTPEQAFEDFIRKYAWRINAATVSLSGVCENIKNRSYKLDDRYLLFFRKSQGKYYSIDTAS